MIGRIIGGAVMIALLTSSAAVRAQGPMSPLRPLPSPPPAQEAAAQEAAAQNPSAQERTASSEKTAEAAVVTPEIKTLPAVPKKRPAQQARRSTRPSEAASSDNMADELNRRQLDGGIGFGTSHGPIVLFNSGD
jgi:hypothetical protein